MHDNHRERLRERFLSEGLDSFEPHQALELLLFYAIPRRDTNELAHRLIERYGSLSGVFDADPFDLEHMQGVGCHTAVLLSVIKPLWRLYRRDITSSTLPLDSIQAACDFALTLFDGRSNESFYVICLDPACRLIRSVMLCEGTVNEVYVHPRLVVETAIRNNASSIILTHNHPLGMPDPSQEDISFTRRLTSAFSAIGIDICDHIIVSGDETYSFVREGKLSPHSLYLSGFSPVSIPHET